MGTNYFLYESPACYACGHQKDPLHIGKSSYGWCFGLHYIPEEGLFSLEDWVARWSEPTAIIRDEYGDTHTPSRLLDIVTKRKVHTEMRKLPKRYDSWEEFYTRNSAIAGPEGLLRRRIYREFCISHGEGTWDMVPGYFR